jgi:hypothetical protein
MPRNAFQMGGKMSGSFEKARKCFDDLSALWNQNSLKLNTQGYCSLRTGDGLEMLLEVAEHANQLLFLCDLGAELDERHHLYLLQQNLFSRDLRCASYCRDPDTGKVLLRYHYPIDALSASELANLINGFVGTARLARAQLAALGDDTKSSNKTNHQLSGTAHRIGAMTHFKGEAK